MYLGKRVLVKHNKELMKGNVTEIFTEELRIILDNGEEILRKFWEVRDVRDEE